MTYAYPARFRPCDDIPGAYTVTFPDIPGAVTQGDSWSEAQEMAQDALEVMLSEYVKAKKKLPKASRRVGKQFHAVTVSALAAAKLALYEALQETSRRKVDLARKLGIPKQHVDRLFDLQHQSRLDQIEKALALLGRRLSIVVDQVA